jgi:hypothetical protein
MHHTPETNTWTKPDSVYQIQLMNVLRQCLVIGFVIQAAPHKVMLHQDEEW